MSSLLLCFAGHHDDAYRRAERPKLERYPTTGAAQFVEVREMVREVAIPVYVTAGEPAAAAPRSFGGVTDDNLLGHGVPSEWRADIRAAAEDSILAIAEGWAQRTRPGLFGT